jgi:hypothetical protein
MNAVIRKCGILLFYMSVIAVAATGQPAGAADCSQVNPALVSPSQHVAIPPPQSCRTRTSTSNGFPIPDPSGIEILCPVGSDAQLCVLKLYIAGLYLRG